MKRRRRLPRRASFRGASTPTVGLGGPRPSPSSTHIRQLPTTRCASTPLAKASDRARRDRLRSGPATLAACLWIDVGRRSGRLCATRSSRTP
eukprot:364175-Chlamydomonas_euryale.AAC.5